MFSDILNKLIHCIKFGGIRKLLLLSETSLPDLDGKESSDGKQN